MSRYEMVQVTLKGRDFTFGVVKMPEDVLKEKLALFSHQTGMISRIEYQDYIFNECVVNLDRVYRFIAEASKMVTDTALVIRNEIEALVVSVNGIFDPDKVVIAPSGLLKSAPETEITIGVRLPLNDQWNYLPPDNGEQYLPDTSEILEILEEHFKIPEGAIEVPDDNPPDKNDSQLTAPPKVIDGLVTVFWEMAGLELKIKPLDEKNVTNFFAEKNTFSELTAYKVYVVTNCILKGEEVIALVHAMGIAEDVGAKTIINDLYNICVTVNPFLRYEKVDFKALRKKNIRSPRAPSPRPKAQGEKEKKGFKDVTKADLLALADRMKQRIIGQDKAVDQIVDSIQISSCGLRDPEKPVAVYMLCGPTGQGKSWTAKVLSEELCGSRGNLIRVDCSEYTQPHDVMKLIGAAPSYVGYDDGGFLTNAIEKNPFSVVLFDELEKANSKLFDILLQVMDDARLTDGKGNVHSFKDAVILLTSNIGVSETAGVAKTIGFGDAHVVTDSKRDTAIKTALKNKFRPEFLNRIDGIVNFNTLSEKDTIHIINNMLETLSGYLSNKNIKATFTDNVSHVVFEKGFSKDFGARPLQRALDKSIIHPIARMILNDEITEGSSVQIDWVDGSLVVSQSMATKGAITQGA